MKILSLFLAVLSGSALAQLEPLLVQPDELVLKADFAEAGAPSKEEWSPRQSTRWTIKDGVLHGMDSSDEYQATKTHHQGFEPRVSCPTTPREFAVRFRIRFSGGAQTPIAPFVEFGHHVARVRFDEKEGLSLLADGETMKVAAAPEMKWKKGQWYRCLAERKGEEFVIQFENGPTLYARHPSYAKPVASGAAGFGVAGPKGGTVDLDDVEIWSIKAKENPGWAKTRGALPAVEPEQLKKKKAKKK